MKPETHKYFGFMVDLWLCFYKYVSVVTGLTKARFVYSHRTKYTNIDNILSIKSAVRLDTVTNA